LLLGLATLRGPHLVVLDEPTNHLDIDSRAALVEAINDYPGAVILVSHDRHLIEACADRLLLVSSGQVAPFEGDLEDYRRLVLSERNNGNRHARGVTSARGGRAGLRRAAAGKRVELAPLRRRIAEAEADVARLTTEIARIDTALAEPGLFDRDPSKAAALAKARAAHAGALARAEEEWLDASAHLDSSNGQGSPVDRERTGV
jgi:ATP-binding cassette subfamily F protein 3